MTKRELIAINSAPAEKLAAHDLGTKKLSSCTHDKTRLCIHNDSCDNCPVMLGMQFAGLDQPIK